MPGDVLNAMISCLYHDPICRMSHIIHVPNLQDRTAIFAVESDLDFISGPSTITIGNMSKSVEQSMYIVFNIQYIV